jgi:ankyrin repeat protein
MQWINGEKDCPELCEISLKHEAEIDAVDENGNQSLHWAEMAVNHYILLVEKVTQKL